MICGADSFVAIEEFGESKEAWLKTFLDLPNGLPSHDMLGRVFAILDPVALAEAFRLTAETDLGAWLFTIAHNRFRSHRRWAFLDFAQRERLAHEPPDHAPTPRHASTNFIIASA